MTLTIKIKTTLFEVVFLFQKTASGKIISPYIFLSPILMNDIMGVVSDTINIYYFPPLLF
ncbi:UNVERIFIED_CONTAM: hypothetical protein Cloal_1232 [Acetivibrio alkalicellulosi]